MKKNKVRIALWSLAFELNSFYIVNAVMALMIAYYGTPERGGFSSTQVMVIASVPGMASLAGTLSTGLLTRRFSQKAVALGANIVLMAQAVFIIWFHESYYAVLAARAVFGLVQGMLMTVGGSLVATHFARQQERDYVMGMRTAFQNGGGMVFSSLAGVIAAAFGWQNAFWLYMLCVIPVLLTAFWLPGDKEAKTGDRAEEGGARPSPRPIGRGTAPIAGEALVLALGACLAMLSCYTFNLNISSKVQLSLGLSASRSGMGIMLSSFGGMVMGLFFHKAAAFLGRRTLSVGIAADGLACLIIGWAGGYPMVLLGCALFGIGYALWVPAINVRAAGCSSPENRVLNMSLVMAGLSVGMALSPWVLQWVSGMVWGGEGLPGQRMVIAAVFCFMIAAVPWRSVLIKKIQVGERWETND